MRKLSFFMALVFILTAVLASCNTSQSTTSSDASKDSSDVSVGETSSPKEESKEEEEPKVPVRENALATPVTLGLSYVKSVEAADEYPDTYGSELTDGVYCSSANYSDESLSGYNILSKMLNVDIDLGYTCDKLYRFDVSYLATNTAGIDVPARMTAYVSEDGKKWKNVGNIKKPTYEEGTMQVASLVLDHYVSGRFIRFSMSGSSSWTFFDEVTAYADIEGEDNTEDFSAAINNAYEKLGTINYDKSGVAIDRDLEKTLISIGKGYTINGKIDSKFPDKGNKMLTDGIFSGYYEGGTWVGFEPNEDVVVTIDLGSVQKDISSVEATFYTNMAVRLYLPVAVKIASIDANGNKTDLGILYASRNRGYGDYTFALHFDEAISARKIEFTFFATESTMFLVEELSVYAHREKTEQESLYPLLNIVPGESNWSSSSEGYNKYQNLILGKTQQIVAGSNPNKSFYANNTPITSTLMTNGKNSGNTDIHNGAFFKFNHGGSRMVIYDLEHTSSVDKFTASFTHQSSWGVNAPSNVTIILSEDGSNWYEAGAITLANNGDPAIHNGELVLEKALKARYVAFSFAVKGWAGCDELEVFGTKNATKATSLKNTNLDKQSLFANKRIEPSEDILGGAKDLCLLYHGTTSKYTEEDLIPYLAYVDKDGNIKDTMFDSFLFLMTGAFPSGAKPYSNGNLSDWLWAINDLFVNGENLIALESAAGKVKEELGLGNDFKYKVTMSVYYPSADITDFGDIDGDGKTENFTILTERIQAIVEYIKIFEEKFASMNFKNIELVGYYWYHEAINSDDTDSIDLINATADAVHDVDKEFFWIPYFQSNGFDSWAKYGFDVAIMQPNYVFKIETPYSNLPICAELTKLYGMGVEMEICSEALNDERFFKKYMEYIMGGVKYGYMNDTIIMYYQSIFDFRNACNSDTVMGRMVYDYTYGFIKDKLNVKPKAFEMQTFETSKNTPFYGEFKFENDLLKEFEIVSSPDRGTVTLNHDGTFTYYPEKEFTGEVEFSIKYSEYLDWSDPCVVKMIIK